MIRSNRNYQHKLGQLPATVSECCSWYPFPTEMGLLVLINFHHLATMRGGWSWRANYTKYFSLSKACVRLWHCFSYDLLDFQPSGSLLSLLFPVDGQLHASALWSTWSLWIFCHFHPRSSTGRWALASLGVAAEGMQCNPEVCAVHFVWSKITPKKDRNWDEDWVRPVSSLSTLPDSSRQGHGTISLELVCSPPVQLGGITCQAASYDFSLIITDRYPALISHFFVLFPTFLFLTSLCLQSLCPGISPSK